MWFLQKKNWNGYINFTSTVQLTWEGTNARMPCRLFYFAFICQNSILLQIEATGIEFESHHRELCLWNVFDRKKYRNVSIDDVSVYVRIFLDVGEKKASWEDQWHVCRHCYRWGGFRKLDRNFKIFEEKSIKKTTELPSRVSFLEYLLDSAYRSQIVKKYLKF